LEADLKAHVEKAGAWVEHKKLLVAWHYRLVEKDMKLTLMAKGRVMYLRL
jgi:trehalose-6-phosphatase